MKRHAVTINVILSVALACCLIVIAVQAAALASRPTPSEQAGEPTTVTQATTATTVLTDGNALLIDTPYGALRYPAAYGDHLKYETASVNGDSTVIRFFCVTEEAETPLFRIAFNAPETGVYIGFLQDGGREIPVSVEYPEQSFSEEQQLERAMAETVNDLLASLREDERFVEA